MVFSYRDMLVTPAAVRHGDAFAAMARIQDVDGRERSVQLPGNSIAWKKRSGLRSLRGSSISMGLVIEGFSAVWTGGGASRYRAFNTLNPESFNALPTRASLSAGAFFTSRIDRYRRQHTRKNEAKLVGISPRSAINSS